MASIDIPDILLMTLIIGVSFALFRMAKRQFFQNYLSVLWWTQILLLFGFCALAQRNFRTWYLDHVGPLPIWVYKLEDAVLWIAGALILLKAIDALFWKGTIMRIMGRPAPALPRYILIGVIIFLDIIAVISFVFESSITGVLATSGVLAGAVGFAMQLNLANLFSGFAIKIEQPFLPGDWIEFEGIEGKVLEINWRAVRLLTRENTVVTIPNRRVSEQAVANYNYPDKRYRLTITVHTDHAVPPTRVKSMLRNAIAGCECVLDDMPLSISINAIQSWSVEFCIRIWVEDCSNKPAQLEEIWSHIWMSLNGAGINFATEKQEIEIFRGKRQKDGFSSDPASVLVDIDIFAALSQADKSELINQVRQREFEEGELICRQGDKGQSMFVVREGLAGVFLAKSDVKREVARIGPGGFFGEMSLLTGEGRQATIMALNTVSVYEISKADLMPIIRKRPEVINRLTEIVLKRQHFIDASGVHHHRQGQNLGDLVKKVKHWFHMDDVA